MPKSIPNPNPNPNVQDVAKPTWAHPNVRDVAKPAWAHPNVLDVAKPAWAPTLAAKPPEECKTESAGRIVKKYLHPAAGRIDTGYFVLALYGVCWLGEGSVTELGVLQRPQKNEIPQVN